MSIKNPTPPPSTAKPGPLASNAAPSQRDVLRAAAWMLGAIGSFSAMAVAGREVSHLHDTFEVMFYRSAVGVVVVIGIAALWGKLGEVQTRNLPLHLLRNLAHFTGQNLWFLAVTLVPLAQVFALEFTSPLWVLFLAPLLLGERVRPIQYAVAILGFGGVLLVAQPWTGSLDPGLFWAGLAAVFFALTNVLTRRLTRQEGVVSILFWLTVLQLIFGAVMAGYDGDVTPPDASTLPWVVLIGLAGLCAHYCLTHALALAPASVVMPVDFLRLPLIAGVGAALYNEALDPMILLGGAVIVAAAWGNLRLAEPR